MIRSRHLPFRASSIEPGRRDRDLDAPARAHRAEVLRLCGELRGRVSALLLAACELAPAELVRCLGSRGTCPPLELLGDHLRECGEAYDRLQSELGLDDRDSPRFGTPLPPKE